MDKPLDHGEKYGFTLKKFVQVSRLYLGQCCHIAIEDNAIDTCGIDANDADCIIRLGLFEEVACG